MASRRAVLVGLTVFTLIGGVAACSSGTSGGSPSGEGGQELTLWSMWKQGEPNQVLLAAAVDAFNKETGNRIKVQWKGRTAAKVLLPTLNTDKPPADIIEGSNSDIVLQLSPTGEMSDLSDVYAKNVPGDSKSLKDVVGSAYVEVSKTAEGVATMVPYQSSTYGWFYDAKKHPELVSSPPKTMDEFFALLDAAKSKGQKPLAQDGDIPGYNANYILNFGRAVMGDKAYWAAFQDKTGQSFLSPGFQKGASMVEKLAKGGYFVDGWQASKFPAGQQKWANNDADFMFNGTWLPREVTPYAKAGFDFQSFPFPSVDGTAPTLQISTIGFGILKKTAHADVAKAFVAFYLQKQFQDKIGSDASDIPVREDSKSAGIFSSLKAQIDAGQVSQVRKPAGLVDFEAKVFFPLDDQLLRGKIGAQEFASKLAQNTAAFWKSQG